MACWFPLAPTAMHSAKLNRTRESWLTDGQRAQVVLSHRAWPYLQLHMSPANVSNCGRGSTRDQTVSLELHVLGPFQGLWDLNKHKLDLFIDASLRPSFVLVG